MSNSSFDSNLQEQVNAMPKQRQPERDLWPGVERALAQQSLSDFGDTTAANDSFWGGAKTGYATVAAIAIAAVLGWQTWLTQSPAIGMELVDALTEQHRSQKQALLVRFEGQAALTENWQSQLDELDQAAKAIRAALAQEPNNLALLKMLQNVHQQQIELIERVHTPSWQQI